MLSIRSEAFEDRGTIPKKYTAEGDNESPPLAWESASDRVLEFALICEDPDAPENAPFVHWLIYGIDASVNSLEEGLAPEPKLTEPEAVQGKNSEGEIGYTGPIPPSGHGWHRYYFRLFALDQKLGLEPGLDINELLDAIRTHIVAEAELVGRYQRPTQTQTVDQKTERDATP